MKTNLTKLNTIAPQLVTLVTDYSLAQEREPGKPEYIPNKLAVVHGSIWKTLVQPKLDYCSQFWSPGDQESINKIESVQRHFFSRVSSMKGLNY